MTATPNNIIDDGGPAFPLILVDGERAKTLDGLYVLVEKVEESKGMSLRDYFAAHATEDDLIYASQAWLKAHPGAEVCPREAARFAHADAMIAARKGGA